MNKYLIMAFVISLACTGCASERLYVKVIDHEGNPISNATVHVGFTSGHVVFAEGKSCDYEARTREDGNAVVRFNCDNLDVYWSVKADGYYPSDTYKEIFKIDVVSIPPAYYNVIMLEHEKNGMAKLWKKLNPQPMIAHGVSYMEDQRLFPTKNGKYGFDMMMFDWLPPLGEGEIADFYLVRRIGEEVPDGIVGYLEFADRCGMYTAKQTGSKTFPSTYEANTNVSLKAQMPFIFDHADDGSKAVTYKDIIGEDEYGVLRTRVVCDEHGKIVQANYSKVLGPFRAGLAYRGWVLYTPCAVFNPRVNDTNLESDPAHSYDPKVKRPSLAP